MPVYTAPTRDMEFVLHDVLEIERSDTPGYAELDRATTGAVLAEAGKLAAEVFAPLNRAGDIEGCRLEAGQVRTPKGFRAAFDALREGGWTTLDCDPAYGGQGMPHLLGTALGEMLAASNMSLNMYQGLTHGAYSAIWAHGSAAQKDFWLPRLASCEWTGTMNLTEPQAGTDLGLLRTRAEPEADGSYRISGSKIFISAGDHDLADNIVHLVLARIIGAPAGVKGISLFIVPKREVAADGSLGGPNGVSVGALEDKMGIHGNSTCVMNYDGARGWLLGEPGKGLKAMFTMMNEARLAVGVQGLALAEVSYQNAVAYARERLQGRAVSGAVNPQGPADPIIAHPDVRRMLMTQRSFIEGARALTFWAASLIDRSQRLGDSAAEGLVSLLIPVIKAVQTDRGFETAVSAQQVWGGHGYIEDNGMSQFVRDARIAMLYEGTNGVQALDLVGRKLGSAGGRHVAGFFALVRGLIAAGAGDAALKAEFLDPLAGALGDLEAATGFMASQGLKSPDDALAGASDYLHLFGHVALGYMWARMAQAARAGLAAGGDAAFFETKLATGRFYMAREIVASGMLRRRILAGAAPVMALAPEDF